MIGLGQVLDIDAQYSVDYLVRTLQTNRANHVEEYQKAVVIYNDDVEKSLEKLKKTVTLRLNGKADDEQVTKVYHEWAIIKKPVDATKMYDQYIGLLQQSASREIKLSMRDANAIINDEWDWAQNAKFVNSVYSSRY